MTETNELNRCPYHRPGLCDVAIEIGDDRRANVRVVADCGASGPWQAKRQDAIDLWNKVSEVTRRKAEALDAAAQQLGGMVVDLPTAIGALQDELEESLTRHELAVARVERLARQVFTLSNERGEAIDRRAAAEKALELRSESAQQADEDGPFSTDPKTLDDCRRRGEDELDPRSVYESFGEAALAGLTIKGLDPDEWDNEGRPWKIGSTVDHRGRRLVLGVIEARFGGWDVNLHGLEETVPIGAIDAENGGPADDGEISELAKALDRNPPDEYLDTRDKGRVIEILAEEVLRVRAELLRRINEDTENRA